MKTARSCKEASTPARLTTRAVGLDPQTNGAVYRYLESLVDRGEINERELELLVDSFKGVKLRVVSSSCLNGYLRKLVLGRVSASRQTDIELLKAMAAFEVLIVVKNIVDETRREKIGTIHSRLVELFSR
jgi:hypothetical protein